MRTRTLAIITALCAALVLAWLFAPKREIATEMRIDADPAAVWAVLTDGQAYPDWNPFIIQMEGKIAEGEILTNKILPIGAEVMTFMPEVLIATENKELRWLGRAFVSGIFDGEHYFQLTPDEGGTRLVHGEVFSGVALWFMDVEQFIPNFEAMNSALAAEVEARALN